MYNLTPALAADWRAWLEVFEARIRASGRFDSRMLDVDQDDAAVRGHTGCNTMPAHAAQRRYDVGQEEAADTDHGGAHGRDGDTALPGGIRIVDDFGPDLNSFWSNDNLLLSQTCGYPLTHALAGKVRIVATPVFDADGCEGPHYRSVLVTRANERAASLADFRGRRAAVNNEDSNSGMNAFRHAVAPFAVRGRFFSSVVGTGSHRASMQALADGVADIAAIDCVTFAFAREALPGLTARLRVIGQTAATPGLPLITSKRFGREGVEALQDALSASLDERPALTRRLKIRAFVRLPLADYDAVVRLERQALEWAYPRLG